MMLDMIPDVILDLAWIVIKIVAIILPMTVAVAYFTYAERRVIGFMQVRMGPNRVGILGFKLWGLAQPFADVFKLLMKEIILPDNSNKFLFLLAPMLAIAPAFAAWAVIPFNDFLVPVSYTHLTLPTICSV